MNGNEAADPLSLWSQFGLAGIVIGAMFWLILTVLKSHKEERCEWRRDIHEQNKDMIDCKRETNMVLRELSNIMQEANRAGRHRADD